MKLQTALILLSATATAQAPPFDCRNILMEKWNRFASDANTYVHSLDKGVVDYGIRKKVLSEWKAVVGCECF